LVRVDVTCNKRLHLRGRRFLLNEAVEMTIYERLRMHEPISTAAKFLNSCQDVTNISVCSGIVFRNNDTTV
jgi:hypothetical protein